MYIKCQQVAIDNLLMDSDMTFSLLKNTLISIPVVCLSCHLSAAEETQQEVEKATTYKGKITAYRAANTPVNYSYIVLSAGKNDFDNYNQKLTTFGIGGQALISESYIFKMGYKAGLLDKDNAGLDLDYQSNTFNLGLGYRYALFESTDIEVDGQLLYNWDSNGQNDNTNQELGYLVGAYINQGIGDTFEGTLGVNYSSEYSQESVNVVLSVTQYVTEYVGVGANAEMGSASDDSYSGDQFYIGAHVRLAFY